jgi:hypothetical protein
MIEISEDMQKNMLKEWCGAAAECVLRAETVPHKIISYIRKTERLVVTLAVQTGADSDAREFIGIYSRLVKQPFGMNDLERALLTGDNAYLFAEALSRCTKNLLGKCADYPEILRKDQVDEFAERLDRIVYNRVIELKRPGNG